MDDETIATFIGFTGADHATAENYLRVRELTKVTDGNVETAITLFMESGGVNQEPYIQVPSQPQAIQEIRAPIAPRRQVLDSFEPDFHIAGTCT